MPIGPSSMTPNLYPIRLGQVESKRLVFEHLSDRYLKEAQFKSTSAVYSYYATLLADGRVEVYDDGFIQGSGPLLKEYINPYDDKFIKHAEYCKKLQLVAEEDERREEERTEKRRAKIMKEMFGE